MAKKYEYLVYGSKNGARTHLYSTTNKKKAVEYYLKHKEARGIQRFVNGIPAGTFQPDVPSKIKFRGRIYKQVYEGPHTKSFATSVANNLRKSGLKCVVKKFKRGYYLYAHV